MADAQVEILSRRQCELGEGPSYDPATDTLWWFDILGRKLIEHRFADGSEIAHDLPLLASAIAIVDERRQLLATETGLHVRDCASGRLELVAPIEADNPGTRSNDSRVHPSGAFWVGTMGRNAEKHAGAIYWYRAGETRRLFPNVSIPNSICFSPDGRTVASASSDLRLVELAGPRVLWCAGPWGGRRLFAQQCCMAGAVALSAADRTVLLEVGAVFD